MTIHHATIKKAEKNGIILTEETIEDIDFVVATWPQYNQVIATEDAKMSLAAMLLIKTLRLEYPAIVLEYEGGQFTAAINNEVFWDGEEVPTLAELLDAAQEQDLDPIGEEIEEEGHHVIVSEHYRALYIERGNRDHCGDWLAMMLDGAFVKPNNEGKPSFDAETFAEYLQLNGVEMSGKWANLPNSGQKGWVGRYRMNGRQKLEKAIAASGKLILPSGTYAVPTDALEDLWARHPDAATQYEENGNGGA